MTTSFISKFLSRFCSKRLLNPQASLLPRAVCCVRKLFICFRAIALGTNWASCEAWPKHVWSCKRVGLTAHHEKYLRDFSIISTHCSPPNGYSTCTGTVYMKNYKYPGHFLFSLKAHSWMSHYTLVCDFLWQLPAAIRIEIHEICWKIRRISVHETDNYFNFTETFRILFHMNTYNLYSFV